MTDLEQDVMNAVRNAIGEAIKSHLTTSYRDTPLTRLIDGVLAKRSGELEKLMNDALDRAFADEFRQQLRDAMAHKLAKVIISKSEGEIEKVANTLRSSPEFRAQLTLAISSTVKEFNKNN